LQQEIVGTNIFSAVQQNALCRRAVPSGTTSLLIVALQIHGHVIVNDKRHVGLVNTHAERVRRHHDRLAVVQEIVLILCPFRVGQTCVIPRGWKAVFPQSITDFLHRFSGGAVHNAAFAVVFPQQLKQFPRLIIGTAYPEKQVFPVKSGMYDFRLLQFQNPCNIRLYLLCCRSGKGGTDRTCRQLFHKHRNIQITLPEILSPLGNAMCLINGDHTHRHLLCQTEKAVRHQPFRCNVQNPALPLLYHLHRVIEFFLRNAAVHIRRRDTHLPESLHLIFHQRDQRRNDNGHPAEQQGRDLIADRLTGSGRHDRQHVPSGQDRIDRLLLSGAE